ncbi:protein D7-like [Lucilia cuprina]|uniref:protein D7-like n=1 Tax=Lucilia cuprina TaxID=7375 RepID=UPI001F05C2EB|nr:protein D7-like [Lucilia cuprina]
MFLSDDDMVECPYNKTHRMLRKRLQSHLLKCRLSYPDVELRKCPFNITHLIPEPEFTHHATNCPDRKLITQYKYDAPEPKEEEGPKHAPIECDEDWDDTDVNDYNPKLYLETAKIIRKPDGANPSERKLFIKKERKRLGDGDESSDEDTKNGVNNDGAKGLSPKSSNWKTDRGHAGRKRSSSPSTSSSSYAKGRSRSPKNKFNRERSRSPLGFRRSNKDHSPPRSRRNASPPKSLGVGNSYLNNSGWGANRYNVGGGPTNNAFNSGRDPYYSDQNNSQAYYDRNTITNSTTSQVPVPPMISYPAPRSYLTTKTPQTRPK